MYLLTLRIVIVEVELGWYNYIKHFTCLLILLTLFVKIILFITFLMIFIIYLCYIN